MQPRADFTIDQDWVGYTEEQHAIWRLLFERHRKLLRGRACPEFLDGMRRLGVAAHGIPDFARLNQVLGAATGWQIVAVPGLVPDAVFFAHLAARRFPSTCFIRRRDQLDYLQEPDVFHDICGHVPLLIDPVFADYMQAYGEGGLKAARLGHLTNLARLYWYTVEFGLIATRQGLRIYGSGILSSAGESVYSLADPRPQRLAFDLRRIMRTRYHIDDYQQTYFVIDDFQQLFAATRPDFTPIYRELEDLADIDPDALLPDDRPVATPHPAVAKKKLGRASARPKFREETPRRRTAGSHRVLHTAPHNLGPPAPMSSRFLENPCSAWTSGRTPVRNKL